MNREELLGKYGIAFTENGALTNSSTHNALLDAFCVLGNRYSLDSSKIIELYKKAFDENSDLAVRYLFYLRDCRKGQGVRGTFRIILRWLAENHSEYVFNNFDNIVEFGRWDDLISLFDKDAPYVDKVWYNNLIEYIKNQLGTDCKAVCKGKDISLLAKWLPSENTSSKSTKKQAKYIRELFGLSSESYRKILSTLRSKLNLVETSLTEKRVDEIRYSDVPSLAMQKYSKAFYRHDKDRYTKYISDAVSGKAKINAEVLTPYDIMHKIYCTFGCGTSTRKLHVADAILADAQWKALPDYICGKENALCMVDTSGSMYGTPIQVAIALGIYCAEKCTGVFHNKIMTFSQDPTLEDITGDDILAKFHSVLSADWGMNTNIWKALRLLLSTAKQNKIPASEMPKKLYIISDMQFDNCVTVNRTVMQNIKQIFADDGYELPSIVFWNVGAYTTGIYHVTINDLNCCIVSGFSPSLFKSIIDGTEKYVDEETGETKQRLDPLTVMLTAILNERYDCIWC